MPSISLADHTFHAAQPDTSTYLGSLQDYQYTLLDPCPHS